MTEQEFRQACAKLLEKLGEKQEPNCHPGVQLAMYAADNLLNPRAREDHREVLLAHLYQLEDPNRIKEVLMGEALEGESIPTFIPKPDDDPEMAALSLLENLWSLIEEWKARAQPLGRVY